MPDKNLTPKQVAAELGISRSTVYNYIRESRLAQDDDIKLFPVVKRICKNRYIIPRESVDAIRAHFDRT